MARRLLLLCGQEREGEPAVRPVAHALCHVHVPCVHGRITPAAGIVSQPCCCCCPSLSACCCPLPGATISVNHLRQEVIASDGEPKGRSRYLALADELPTANVLGEDTADTRQERGGQGWVRGIGALGGDLSDGGGDHVDWDGEADAGRRAGWGVDRGVDPDDPPYGSKSRIQDIVWRMINMILWVFCLEVLHK